MRLALVCLSAIALISPVNVLQADTSNVPQTKSFAPTAKTAWLTTDWNELENTIEQAERLIISNGDSGKTHYIKGEKLQLGIHIEKAGYLNVVSVTESGETTVLFPNKYHHNNKVNAGTFVFPTAQMKFDLTTQAPFGKTLVVAFLTSKAINLYQQNKAVNNDIVFKQLSSSEVKGLSKGFAPTAREKNNSEKLKAGKLELITCESAENCS